MSAYISTLNASVERDRAQHDEQQRARSVAARELLTPLEDRLARLLATIPAEVQNEGLSLSGLQASLRGRRRGSAHPGELGMALRRLGYQRHRHWRGNAGFQALWFPSAARSA